MRKELIEILEKAIHSAEFDDFLTGKMMSLHDYLICRPKTFNITTGTSDNTE